MSQEKKAIIVIAVCLAVIGVGAWWLRDKEAPAVVTQQRLNALQVSIEAWAAAHDGKAPESLDELGLPEEAISDHKGARFDYITSDDGTVKVISYGADGKPGGHAFHADTEVSFQLPQN